MNDIETRPTRSGATTTRLAASTASFARPVRPRSRHRWHGRGSDLAWAIVLFVVLVWMTFIALTLWH